MSDWQEVTGSVDNIWNDGELKKGDTFIGVFKRVKRELGGNNSNLWIFERDDGDDWGIWGTTLLDTRFETLEDGEEVKVEYQGLVQSQKVKGRSYHDFKVWKKKYDKPKNADEDVLDSELDDIAEILEDK